MADPYYLTHTGAELDEAVDKILNAVTLTEIVLSGSEITVAGKEFQIAPGTRYVPSGTTITIKLGTTLTETIKAENIKQGVTILGITGTYTGA